MSIHLKGSRGFVGLHEGDRVQARLSLAQTVRQCEREWYCPWGTLSERNRNAYENQEAEEANIKALPLCVRCNQFDAETEEFVFRQEIHQRLGGLLANGHSRQ